MAPPESVGISSKRLRRLDAAMQRLVDGKQVAGLVTLLERHGKIVDFSAVGRQDVRKPDPMQKDTIFRFGAAGTWFWIDPVEDLAFVGMVQHESLETTRPIHGLSRSLVYQAILD